MFRNLSIPVLTGLCLALAGCGSRFVGIDPDLSAGQRDQIQRIAMRPPADATAHYEVVTVEADIAIPLDRFLVWFTDVGAPQFASFMTGTPAIPGAVRTDSLLGSWRSVGDRRRVVFSDGNTALEEITVDQKPRLFQYEMWNLTNDTGRYITYAIADFSFSGGADGTRVKWTYSFRPLAWPDGWFIRRVVQEDYRHFMETTLAAMKVKALYDGRGK